MRKAKIVLLGVAILLMCALFAGCNRNNDTTHASFDAPDNFMINAQTTPEINFGQVWGNGDFGMVDISLTGDNSLLILDSIDEKIFRVGNGEVIESFDLDIDRANYNMFKITEDANSNIYILSGRAFNAFIRLSPDGDLHFSDMEGGFSYVDFASTVAFTALDENKVRVTCFTEQGLVNLTFDISNETAAIIDTLYEFYITEDYLFTQTLITDEGYSVGHSTVIELFDFEFNKLHEITYTSENYVFGAAFHGKHGDYYILEITEMDESNNVEYFLALADENGVIVNRFDLPIGRGVSLKTYNSQLYLFVQTNRDIRVNNALDLLLSDVSGWQYDVEPWERVTRPTTPAEKPDAFVINGNIADFDTANGMIDVQEIEWLTQEDAERIEELGILPDDMPGGFYIYRPDIAVQSFNISYNTVFSIIDYDDLGNMINQETDIETFASHVQSWMIFIIEIANGEAVSIAERYLP